MGKGALPCVGKCENGTVPGDSSSRHVLSIASGGVEGGALFCEGGGSSASAGSARGRDRTLNPHRSRGEALVRLSIPNVLRCLEFFFPDRRYLCRAARGSLIFAGRKATVPHLPGGQRRPVFGWMDCSCHFQLQLTGIQRTFLTLPRFPWGYTFHRPRRGINQENERKLYCVPC